MEQKSKYEIEIENFRKIFDDKKNMRIAIYGIGRRTATLLPGITDYNITGLLDRDENNVGKELCDIKVISIDNIKEKADLIIINSDPSNYEIIFKRISGEVTIPVYYADGRLACLSDKDKSYEQNEYWKSSFEELKGKIDQADIVSFDIFDTLIMRKIFSPEDVFRLLGENVKNKIGNNYNFADVRARAAAKSDSYASINDIYDVIKADTGLSEEIISDILSTEKSVDLNLCTARYDIAELYKYCMNSGKETYLISDMYYCVDDIKKILIKCGLPLVDDNHIWVSCEKNKDKISGSMWQEYFNKIINEKKGLHVGDNITGDIRNPQEYGINTYYVMSAKEMLLNSSAKDLASYVNNISDSVCMGLVIEKLFNSPFALAENKGKVSFGDSELYGYCLYGPIIEKFLIWLYYNSRNDGINKLLFFARDGYFLEKDYKIISDLLGDGYKQDICYLPISRRLIYMATMRNVEDFKRVAVFPYVGTFGEYMKSRFNVESTNSTSEYNNKMINAVGDSDKLLNLIEPYKEKIIAEAELERKNYYRFLKKNNIFDDGLKVGTVDLGYYGTNQYYLQKFTGIKTKGYCFYACLSKDSVYINDIDMKGCFQYGTDYTAENSPAKKKNMYIETFLTASHGMIRYIDSSEKIICESDKNSQKNFYIKEQVNDGAVKFISDYIQIAKEVIVSSKDVYVRKMEERSESIEDRIFYNMLDGMADVSENILKGFYFDNDFVGGREVKVEI